MNFFRRRSSTGSRRVHRTSLELALVEHNGAVYQVDKIAGLV